MTDHAVGHAAEKHFGSARLPMTSHDDEIREPFFGGLEDQGLRCPVFDNQFEVFIRASGYFSNASGCSLDNPNMQLTFLALVVIPELRISDKGLIDVERFEVIPVVEARP